MLWPLTGNGYSEQNVFAAAGIFCVIFLILKNIINKENIVALNMNIKCNYVFFMGFDVFFYQTD